MWGPCFVWAPKLHDGPGQSYLRHGVAIDAKVVKATHCDIIMYTANNVNTAIQLEETDRQMIQLTCCTFGGTCVPVKFHLFTGPGTLTGQILGPRNGVPVRSGLL